MASAFKIPKLVVKPKNKAVLPKFDWNLFQKEKKLGSGSFGSVYLGVYAGRKGKVVTKKIKVQSIDSKARCRKEAALLNSVKGHQNIVKFLGFCEEPCGIMMEYLSFDFSPFGAEKQVSTLADFLRLLDEEYDFESFSHLLPVCAQDIIRGLEYLHSKNIAHRDLKLGNILVSNQHYSNQSTSELDLSNAYVECPIVCKLADFGLSRSHEMQTKTILQTKTDSINRGTPSYMAPEIHLNKLVEASQLDLKKTDIWSLGLVMYTLVNPNVPGPYYVEFGESGDDDETGTTSGKQPTTSTERHSQRQLSTFPSHTHPSSTPCSVPGTVNVIPHHQPSIPSASSLGENCSRLQNISLNHYPSMASGFHIPPTFKSYGPPTIPHTFSQFQTASAVLPPAPARFSACTAPTQNTTNIVEQPALLPKSFFFLKWVQGTRVSKCYGCNGAIQNPPLQRPDDLIVFCRDIREYRDRITGQLQRSTTQQNVHFHLRKECIMMKYPGFSSDVLKVGPEFLPYLHQEHFQQLAVSFGLNLING